MPDLREVHEAIKDKNSKMLAINIINSDKLEDVQALIKAENIQYPVLLDEKSDATSAYGIRSIPTVIIINKDGVVAEHHVGSYDKDELLKLLEANR